MGTGDTGLGVGCRDLTYRSRQSTYHRLPKWASMKLTRLVPVVGRCFGFCRKSSGDFRGNIGRPEEAYLA